MGRRSTTIALLSLGILAGTSAGHHGAQATRAPAERKALAVIVNPKNPTTNLSFNELRTYMKLDRQFWPDKGRVELFLRPGRSPEMEILLARVYRMSNDELRKYWVGKVFRGEIPSRPAVVPNVKAARSRVLKVTGALTVVLWDEVPEGVRTLTIDGKKPTDADYPLYGDVK